MTILLTGGTGYIGSHTAASLLESGQEVVLLDNLSNSQADVVSKLEALSGQKIPFIKCDLRETKHVSDVLKKFDIQSVMHFAGLKAVGESVSKPLEYYSHNVGGTISLLQAMMEAGTKTMVFSSSATVYGMPQRLPIDEEHPVSAINPYGRSKLIIEDILSDLAQSDATWRFACLRYFNPIGSHESGLIGEEPIGISNNLAPYIARVAAGLLPHLNVFGDDYNTPDGTGIRDYVHVMDLAEGHMAGLNFLKRTPGWHAFNLGTGVGYSVLELVQAFEEASAQTIPYKIAPRRKGDVAECYAQVKKAESDLAWKASRSLHDMCFSAWKFESEKAEPNREAP
jgi:UDP-glucose 4-epimerase